MKKLIGILSILTLVAGTAVAQEGGEKECTHKERALGKHGKHRAMLEDIPNVTEGQKATFKQIREEGKKKAQGNHDKMRAIKQKLQDLKTADNPNYLNEINSLIDDKHRIQAEMDKERAVSHIKMRTVLTPEG